MVSTRKQGTERRKRSSSHVPQPKSRQSSRGSKKRSSSEVRVPKRRKPNEQTRTRRQSSRLNVTQISSDTNSSAPPPNTPIPPKTKNQIYCAECHKSFEKKQLFLDHTLLSPKCKYLLRICYGCNTKFCNEAALSQHLNNIHRQRCGIEHYKSITSLAKSSTMPLELELDDLT